MGRAPGTHRAKCQTWPTQSLLQPGASHEFAVGLGEFAAQRLESRLSLYQHPMWNASGSLALGQAGPIHGFFEQKAKKRFVNGEIHISTYLVLTVRIDLLDDDQWESKK